MDTEKITTANELIKEFGAETIRFITLEVYPPTNKEGEPYSATAKIIISQTTTSNPDIETEIQDDPRLMIINQKLEPIKAYIIDKNGQIKPAPKF